MAAATAASTPGSVRSAGKFPSGARACPGEGGGHRRAGQRLPRPPARWRMAVSLAQCHSLNATSLKGRAGGRIVSVATIIAVAVNTQGRREIVGLGIGPSEASSAARTMRRKTGASADRTPQTQAAEIGRRGTGRQSLPRRRPGTARIAWKLMVTRKTTPQRLRPPRWPAPPRGSPTHLAPLIHCRAGGRSSSA
jgi:hypothetical protein